jgi:hypothetical protein
MLSERTDFNFNDISYGRFGFNRFIRASNKMKNPKGSSLKQPPWKGNSFNPNHLHRFNYLDENEATNTQYIYSKIILKYFNPL